jgi:YtkA-like
MRKLLIATLGCAALVIPGSAAAGGWATAGLGPPDDGLQAGDTWNARVTILQHGQTPLSGVEPTVTIRNDDDGTTQTFPARPTGEVGVYEAKVRFPSSGTWSYEVYDGFEQYGGAQTHTFGPISIAPGSGGGVELWPFVLVGLALVLIAGSTAWMARARRRAGAVPALR